MIEIADAQKGLTEWLEKHVISKIPGEGKRALLTVTAKRIINNPDGLVDFLSKNFMLSAGNIIKDGKFDESFLVEYREELGKGKLQLSIPFIGEINIDAEAVDQLYEKIISV